jgi:hypothetical protein
MNAIQPTVLARFASKSNPSKSHEVRRGADGVVYCGCASWRFQKNHPSNRTCKHVEQWKAQTSVGGKSLLDVLGVGPVAIRAPRKARVAKAAPVQVSLPLPVIETTVEEEPLPEYRRSAWERILDDSTDFG